MIKEFKGSLKSIFDDDKHLADASDLNAKADIDLPIDRIKPSLNQPRKIFNEDALNELTQSIKENGIIQPILVRPLENGCYEIIVGERRFRAAKRAGLEKIPAIIRELNQSERMACVLIENIQRENLNPLEEAEAILSLINECKMTHNQVAASIGRSRTAVSNLLRLLELADQVKQFIHSGLIEMGHARALLSLDPDQQIAVSEKVIKKSLSVRETEKLVRNIHRNKGDAKNMAKPDPFFESRAESFSLKLAKQSSTPVNVLVNHTGKGRVVIHFDSIEKAYWLMDHLKVEY